MLTSDELAAMQTTATAALPGTADVLRVTRTVDGLGGNTEAWGTAVAGVACRIAPGGGTPSEQLIAEQVQAVQLWTVSLPASTDITEADRILSAGRTFEVLGVLAPRSWELARRTVCREL